MVLRWTSRDEHRRSWELAWLAYWSGLSVALSLIAYKLNWVPHPTGSIEKDLSSGFAPFLQSLVDSHRFVDVLSYPDAPRTTTRLPAVPLFHWLLSFLIGRSVLLHLLAKNLIFFGVCAYAVRRLARARGLGIIAPFLIFGLVYLNPVGLRILPTLGGEEGYYAPLLVLLFVLLSAPTWTPSMLHVVGVVLALLCLTKSTLTIVALVALGLVAIAAPKKWSTLVPAAYVVVVLATWSLWSYDTTQRWTHVVNISSYDGVNFFKGNNAFVADLYPDVHLDVLDSVGITNPPDDIRADEWAVGDYFRDRGKAYLLSDLSGTLRFLAFKTAAPFLLANSPARIYLDEPTPLAELPRIAERGRTFSLKSRGVAMGLWLYKALWLASLVWALRSFLRSKDIASGAYLAISAGIAGPFVVGFAYINHLCVLYTLMILYWSERMGQSASR